MTRAFIAAKGRTLNGTSAPTTASAARDEVLSVIEGQVDRTYRLANSEH